MSNQRKILENLYPKRKFVEKKDEPVIYPTCFDKIITDCAEIKNEQCVCLNYVRQLERTTYETIEVGLQLPNSEGQLIRFIPRYIQIITNQG